MKPQRIALIVALLLAALLISSSPEAAQGVGGTISRIVSEPTTSVLPGVVQEPGSARIREELVHLRAEDGASLLGVPDR